MAANDEMVSLREYIDTLWAAHYREHVLLSEAVSEAKATVTAKLVDMNELRQQITSERGSFVTRDTLDVRETAMMSKSDTRYTEILSRVGSLEKWKDNMTGRLWAAGAILVILNALAAIALNYFRK